MVSQTLKDEIQNLTPLDRKDLIRFALSLDKNDKKEPPPQNLEPKVEETHPTYGIPKRNIVIETVPVETSISLKDSLNQQQRNVIQEEEDVNTQSLVTFLLSIAEAGEEVLRNGGPELPNDLATNHDHYLYGKPKK